uniref:PDZ domain containing ring finger 4 n=1 Tax=Rousettus aegyptiacus TaxID=9407 RepID=A0A7J8JKG3_ROUAE|nr:PDZ domain containing ring finger 4 [Rousettus aegyptiacus]
MKQCSALPMRWSSRKNKKKKKAQQTRPHLHPTTMRRTVEWGAQMKVCGMTRAQSRRMQPRIPTTHL